MSELKLLTSQRNDIFKCIQDNGFAPTEFQWELGDSIGLHYTKVPLLIHHPTGFYFEIHRGDDGFYCSFSPGDEAQFDSVSGLNWGGVLKILRRWLGYVAREIHAPDLWDALSSESKLVNSIADQQSDNSPFTVVEREQVVKGLDEIKRYLLGMQGVGEGHQRIIETRFAYLEDAANRLGRKDWLAILISSLLGLAMQVGLQGDSTREFLRFASHIVRELLGGVLYLPFPH